jgi:hypothetical protein
VSIVNTLTRRSLGDTPGIAAGKPSPGATQEAAVAAVELEPGLFSQVFVSATGVGELVTDAVLNAMADDAVEQLRARLSQTWAPDFGPSGAVAPPSMRSGAMKFGE